jgi:hypothetical protein
VYQRQSEREAIMQIRNIAFALIIFLIPLPGADKSVDPPSPTLTKSMMSSTITFDGNRIRSDMENNGTFVSPNIFHITGWAGMEWPQGYGAWVNFDSGIWIGGQVDGESYVSAVRYGSDFVPGPYGGDSGDPAFRFYKIQASDFDEPYNNPDMVNWPAALGAPWIDANDDSVYNVYDGDRPRLIGDQMIWSVVNDGDELSHNVYQTKPGGLGVELQMTVWGWDRRDSFGDMMFVKVLVINKGSDSIDSTYIGIWDDPDVGDYYDDFVGCDTTLALGYCYSEYEDSEYGPHFAPALGYDLLQGPIVPSSGDTARTFGRLQPGYKNLSMESFLAMMNSEHWDDPGSDIQAYNALTGLMIEGSPIVNTETGQTTKYAYPDDPRENTGSGDGIWVDSDDHASADRRFLMSSGPFTFAPGDSQEVIFAVMLAAGSDLSSSITALKQSSSQAQILADNDFDIRSDITPGDFPLSVSPVTVTADNMNDDGQANNGEHIRISFSVTNQTTEPVSALMGVSPAEGDIYTQGTILGTIADLPGDSIFTPAPVDYEYSIVPTFASDSIHFRLIFAIPDTQTAWLQVERSLAVVPLSWTPTNEVIPAEQVTGDCEGEVGFRIVNPNLLTGHVYQVTFSTEHYGDADTLETGTGVSLWDSTAQVLLLDRHGLPDPKGYDFPITDGFKLVIIDQAVGMKGIWQTANANGPITGVGEDPTEDVCWMRFFQSGEEPTPTEQAQGGWVFISLGGAIPFDWDSFNAGIFREGANFGRAGGNEFEMRFTSTGSKAISYWISQTVVDVPFELWNLGVNPYDTSDDFQMICWLLDLNFNDVFDFSEDDPGSSEGDDPASDWIYWRNPQDTSPGTVGYDAVVATGDYGVSELTSKEVFARTRLMNWNRYLQGGGYPNTLDSAAAATAFPEVGTILRFVPNKSLRPEDVYRISTLRFLALEGGSVLPRTYMLYQNFPNPFNPATTIQFDLPAASEVTLTAYDLLGREVITLQRGLMEGGYHSIHWGGIDKRGRRMPSGIYIARLRCATPGRPGLASPEYSKSIKMVLLK